VARIRSLSRGLLTLTCCLASAACGADGETDALDGESNVARQVSVLDAGTSVSDAGTAQQPVKPYVSAIGIGVSDLAASNKFYTDVFGLKSLYSLKTPYWNETVLEDVRGNHVVTMDFTRKRNTKNNPVKLVFGVARAAEFYQKVLASGGSETNPPQPPKPLLGTIIGFAQDPDGYLVELVEVPSFTAPVLVGVGIGVNSLSDSADFYTRVLGLKYVRDIAVPGFINEKDLASQLGRGPNIQLMDYEDPTKAVTDVPAKIVLNVPDAAGFADFVKLRDPTKLLQAPAPYENTGMIVGMARDLEGYLIEILQPPATDAGVRATPAGGLDAGR
jgi:lactoylglutathione lyase